MKIKAILITAVLVVGAGAVTSYFVRRSHEANIVKVEVVPVTTVNNAAYSFGDSGTVSGTIISRDTQVVTLDTSHDLVNVYVQQGDRVKKGDKLLEYDMLGDELKEEMEELTKMGLELNLENMKKDLETLKSGRMPESMGGGDTGSSSGASSLDEDDDSDSDSDSGSDEEDNDSAANADANGRTHASVQQQGGGAVGAADTFSSLSLAGANAKKPYSGTLSSSDLIRALEELRKGLLKKPASESDQLMTDEDGEIVVDSSGDLFAAGDDVLDAAGEDGETTSPLTVSELFEMLGAENTANLQDAIPTDGASAGDTLFSSDDPEGSDNQNSIQDGIFDEGASTPALVSSMQEDPDDAALISSMEGGETFIEDGQTDENGGNTPDNDNSEDGTGNGTDGTGVGAKENQDPPDPQEPPVILDETEVQIPIELETNFDGDILIDDEETIEESTDIIAEVNSFLSTVNAITLAVDSGWGAIDSQMDAIDGALQTFRNTFGEGEQHETTDLFGENVVVTTYTVSQDVRSQVGEATAEVLQTAYDRLCAFHFIHSVMALNPTGMPSSSIDPTWASANEQALRSVVSELASLPQSMWIPNPATGKYEFSSQYAAMNNGVFSGESMTDFLRGAVLAVNQNYVMEEPSSEQPVISTEGKLWTPSTSTDTGDEGVGFTAEELAEAIKEQEKNIKETELQIREADLGIKEYKKVLDGKIVYANMDGIVKSAGTLESSTGNSFITITGKAGLYVKGSINELALDTVKVGDTITGTSYETGSSFTAEIVEISEYPDESSNSFYGFGDENKNSSYYPFYAYIENAEGLEVDSYVDLSLSKTNAAASADPSLSGGLSLDEYFIRTDNNGRSFCYVRGEDGLLEKRYLELGANFWGVVTIKSGLTPKDCIAFPYGDGVEEGAQTVKVDYLSAIEGDIY